MQRNFAASTRWIFTLVVLLLVAPRAARAQGATPPNPGSVTVSATASGAQVYTMTCAACHQANGVGLGTQYPPLASSEFVVGDERRLIHIVLRGLTGEVEVEGEMFKGEMPGWAPALNDAQVAAVLSYVRKSFGNNAPAITPEKVAQIRAATVTRKTPYTIAELAKVLAASK